MSPDWCNLNWSDWIPFSAPAEQFRQLSAGPGLYRVRPIGHDLLIYIGQTTGTGLRRRTRQLAVNTVKEEMPWNGPHRGAPCLWAWADAEDWEYEVSGTSSVLDSKNIQGLEAMLFWKYRTERSQSSLCNHHKFHEDYVRPKHRKFGIRGGRLPYGEKNPKGGLSWPALQIGGEPVDSDWMCVNWSNPVKIMSELNRIDSKPGVYKIWDEDTDYLHYIGLSINVRSRIAQHSTAKDWISKNTICSVYYLPNDIPNYQLKEIEDDLIGAYFFQKNTIPTYQDF